jgi:hypothetical protein
VINKSSPSADPRPQTCQSARRPHGRPPRWLRPWRPWLCTQPGSGLQPARWPGTQAAGRETWTRRQNRAWRQGKARQGEERHIRRCMVIRATTPCNGLGVVSSSGCPAHELRSLACVLERAHGSYARSQPNSSPPPSPPRPPTHPTSNFRYHPPLQPQGDHQHRALLPCDPSRHEAASLAYPSSTHNVAQSRAWALASPSNASSSRNESSPGS